MVIHFQEARCETSCFSLLFQTHFLHGSEYWGWVFYTRSNGVLAPATVVGTVEDGLFSMPYVVSM